MNIIPISTSSESPLGSTPPSIVEVSNSANEWKTHEIQIRLPISIMYYVDM